MIGCIVGADQTQEWLLPWWWEHYTQHNTYPVAFIDFGLSFEMKAWCRERGELLPLRMLSDHLQDKQTIDPSIVERLEKQFGTQFWQSREAWFKKPFGCLLSPFDKTIWFDLDCEIRGSIEPLFKYEGLALAKDMIDPPDPHPIYNSGVIVFGKDRALLQRWADDAMKQNGLFRGDQELLSFLIGEEKLVIEVLPNIYNWSRCSKENPEAIVYHWHGEYGKCVIAQQLLKKNR